MTQQAAPADIARAFTEAWTSRQMEVAAGYVADDVVFDGPLGHVDGKAAYVDSLERLARNLGVTGVRVLAAYGDGAQALIMYELLSERYGVLTCAKLLTFRDGTIKSDRLAFDSYPVRAS
jgi:SnoaL-like domain